MSEMNSVDRAYRNRRDIDRFMELAEDFFYDRITETEFRSEFEIMKARRIAEDAGRQTV